MAAWRAELGSDVAATPQCGPATGSALAEGRRVGCLVGLAEARAGGVLMSRRSMGFTEQDNETDGMEEIKRMFTPEFRNRLDGIIQFKALDERTISNVVDKFIIELEHQLEEKRVTMMVDDKARAWLARKGYDPKMGARPMARVIQEHLKRALADELLFGRLSKGGDVKVTLDESGDDLEVEVLEKEQVAG